MIVYFDTSALVKLFAEETNSATARDWAMSAALLMVSQIAWTEFFAAMALQRRTAQLPESDMRAACRDFEVEWPRYQRLGTDATLFQEAGQLALQFDLRACDSVQLATLRRAATAAGPELRFGCFDKALNRAAEALGIATLSPPG